MLPDYLKLWLFIALFNAVLVAMAVLSKILRPSNSNPTKDSTYECGQPPWGNAHDYMLTGILRYFIYALIFFIFDAVLWMLVTYSVTAKTFSNFTGFLVYLSIVFMALVCFLRFSEKWEK